jgi:hypothetical protein
MRETDDLGEDGCRSKLVSLFDTLHRNPELCKLVHKLGRRVIFGNGI